MILQSKQVGLEVIITITDSYHGCILDHKLSQLVDTNHLSAAFIHILHVHSCSLLVWPKSLL